jgi:hypothetical protein
MTFICYGLASQHLWSRHLVIVMFSLIIVYASILGAIDLIDLAIMWRALISGLVFGGALVWYFISNGMFHLSHKFVDQARQRYRGRLPH